MKLPRRQFLHLAAGAAALFVAPRLAAAQTVPVIGYVAAKNANPERLAIFKKGLLDLGYVEDNNIHFEYRDAVLDAEYHGLMADLTNRKIDVIIAANVAATVAAAKATTTIPIVMLAVNDPVGVGVVKSLERPGTNVTGTTVYAPPINWRTLTHIKDHRSQPRQSRDGSQRQQSEQPDTVRVASIRSQWLAR
jgi:putative ABC transport system substrate-binding protein